MERSSQVNWLNEIDTTCFINDTRELKYDWKLSCNNAHRET